MIGYNYGYPMMEYGYSTFWWLHILFQIFWVAVLTAIIVMIIRWRSGKMSCHHRHSGSSAIDLLKERYVKGEISREEFEEKKKDIG